MNARTITVILADDHALVRDMLRERLGDEGDFVVIAATASAEEALKAAEAEPPTVALFDIDMPGLSAFDAARTLKAKWPKTRVMFLSAFIQDGYIRRALEVEASGYLAKSEPTETIVAAIRAVAGGAARFSAAVGERFVVEASGARLIEAPHTRTELLTPRELDVLSYLALGKAKREVANLLGISPKTVDHHASHIMDKLDIHDRVALARFAIREGLVKP
ncbi:conserved hypothetical protein [uncultured Defluviicoccus sp.]|uniref:DNA-binding response regulator n=1 Tax=metagenome TaxID=256318 RepID=A0A380THL7_9ZZZZ|nr:conserved hypothetical protein [uncultured Defluviicoccus sp.]